MRIFLCPSRNRIPLNKKKLPIDKAYQLTVFALIYFWSNFLVFSLSQLFKLRSLVERIIYLAGRSRHLR